MRIKKYKISINFNDQLDKKLLKSSLRSGLNSDIMRFNNTQGFRATVKSKITGVNDLAIPALDSLTTFNRNPGDPLSTRYRFDKEIQQVKTSSGESTIMTTTNPSVNIDRSKMHTDNVINAMSIKRNYAGQSPDKKK